jgi:hypothetical protein
MMDISQTWFNLLLIRDMHLLGKIPTTRPVSRVSRRLVGTPCLGADKSCVVQTLCAFIF